MISLKKLNKTFNIIAIAIADDFKPKTGNKNNLIPSRYIWKENSILEWRKIDKLF